MSQFWRVTKIIYFVKLNGGGLLLIRNFRFSFLLAIWGTSPRGQFPLFAHPYKSVDILYFVSIVYYSLYMTLVGFWRSVEDFRVRETVCCIFQIDIWDKET